MSEKNGSLILNTDQLGMHLAEPSMDELMHDYAQIRHVYAAGIREITSRLEVLQSEFQYRGRHNPIHHIESRVKTLTSVIKKLKNLGLPLSIATAKKSLRDIAGVRVVCCYVDDIYRIAELLLAQDDVSLVEKKDYIEYPQGQRLSQFAYRGGSAGVSFRGQGVHSRGGAESHRGHGLFGGAGTWHSL